MGSRLAWDRGTVTEGARIVRTSKCGRYTIREAHVEGRHYYILSGPKVQVWETHHKTLKRAKQSAQDIVSMLGL